MSLRILAALAAASLPCLAQTNIGSLSLSADPATLTSLGFQLTYTGDDDRDATATVQYRAAGESVWRTGYPLFRVLPETVFGRTVPKQFAGSIVDLKPATSYEVRVRVQDPDGMDTTLSATAATRPVPAMPANPRAVSVSNAAALRTAISGAQPGDVITLQPGTYAIQWLEMFPSGTAANPIVIRGASQSGVILDGGSCADCNILEIYSNYVTVESLTIQNGFQAIRFQGTSAQGNVVRRVVIRDVEYGINGRGAQRGFYYADNMLTGRVQFPRVYTTDNGANGSYGIALHGSGHVVAHNHISGFANCITMGAPGARGLDIYGNEIPYAYDDAIELDGSEGNVRVFRNRFTNVFTGVSVQPVFGGPGYIFRNVGFNFGYTPLKFHSRAANPNEDPSGVLVFHNTFASPIRALNVGSPLPNHNSVLLNNVFLGPAAPQDGQIVEWFAPLDRVTFDYNGYYPDGSFLFRPPGATGLAPTFASVFSRFGLEQHGRVLSAATLANGLLGPASFTTLQTPKDMSLAANSPALDVAAPLAGFNDSYSGGAADLGAQESGCPVPVYGPRPVGSDESNQALACGPVSTNAVPNPLSVTQAMRSGSRTTFTLVASDANGWQDITRVSMLVGTSTAMASSCVVELDRAARQMYLWNDAGSARQGPLTLGTAATLQNSRCMVNGQGSSVVSFQTPNQLNWKIALTFVNGYGSQKSIYAKADDAASTSGWKLMGTVR